MVDIHLVRGVNVMHGDYNYVKCGVSFNQILVFEFRELVCPSFYLVDG